MKRSLIPVLIYAALAIVAFIKCMGEGYWGIGTSASLLLTLPWSTSMTFFLWALIHDGARALLIFLVPFAALNGFILYKITVWLNTLWLSRHRSSS
jgi:hypothetical protein